LYTNFTIVADDQVYTDSHLKVFSLVSGNKTDISSTVNIKKRDLASLLTTDHASVGIVPYMKGLEEYTYTPYSSKFLVESATVYDFTSEIRTDFSFGGSDANGFKGKVKLLNHLPEDKV